MTHQRLGNSLAAAMKCELKVWHNRFDKDGEQVKIAVDEASNDDKNSEEEYALVVTRSFDDKNRLTSTTLSVNSPHILKAFREVVKHHPSVATDFLEPFEIQSPYQILYHHWEDLDKYRTDLDDDDDEARMYMNLLFEFMQTEIGPSKDKLERQIRSGQCDFAHLWLVFKPGMLAVTRHKSYSWLLKIVKTAYEENHSRGKYLEVHCAYTDHDGSRLGEAKKVINIYQKQEFGQNDPAIIKDLTIFPYSHLEVDDGFEDGLRKRGDEFVSYSERVSVWNYDGLAEYIKDPPPDYFHPEESDEWVVWRSYTEKGRIILDRGTYEEKTYQTKISPEQRGSSLDRALCPPFVFGYSCNRKEWCRFILSFIRDPNWRPDPLAGLALPSDKKTLVQAVVTAHKFPEGSRDKVQQKGKGLVCLLHGPPGSGKTLTAECAAELTHRALFSCTMSELNKYNSAWYFEYRLSEVLELATTWNAVVLLDEADVFLEARRDDSPDAAERNALVAVFLKHLEYFGGIVFLTTNRIHVFDLAMKSRVHLALGYDAPNEESRRFIWVHNLRQLEPEEVDSGLAEKMGRLAVEDMNGREIANAVTTASSLARFNSEKLQLKHLETVVNVRRDFEKSLIGKKKELAALDSSRRDVPDGYKFLRRGSLLDEV